MPRVLIVQNKTFHPLIVASRLAQIEVESISTVTPAELRDRPGLGACILCLPIAQNLAMCRQIKADAPDGGVPIVLYLDPADPESIAAGLDAGMDSFISARTSPEGLAQRLKRVVYGQRPLPGLGQNQHNGVVAALLEEWASVRQQQHEDVSRRRLAENVLNQQQQLVLTLINHLPERIFVKDAQGHYVLDNLSHQRFLGKRSPDEVLGKTAFDLFPPDLARRFTTHDRVVLESGQPLVEQVEQVGGQQGEVRWISTSKIPLPDPDTGKPMGLIGVTRDITDQKRTQDQLMQERDLLHCLMDNVPDSIYFKDAESRFARINFALATFLGLNDPADAIGKSDFDFLVQEHADGTYRDEQEVMRTGQPIINKEECEVTKDGRSRWVWTTKMPLVGADGRIHGTFGISRDISRRKQIEIELSRARDAAEAANRAKSQFLCNVSHEIRTPMNGIMGMTELLLDTPLSEQQRDYLTLVMSSAEEMMRVVDDILDFSKIEAGMLDLCSVPFDIRESLGDTVKTLALRAHRKGLELACHVHPDVPRFITGDPHRLRQVVVNLVGNAIKFTEQGEVVVDCALDRSAAGAANLHFSVRDTGIGIPPDMLEAVFKPFMQVESSLNRRYGGTGLGLAISTRLVEMMQGRIWAESTLGQGSTFHFMVDMPACPEPTPARLAPHLLGLPVLVVDDNATNRRILEEMLISAGMEPTTLGSAAEALAWLSELENRNETIPLILLDAMMPEVDGFMLARKIRERDHLAGATIMMLSSSDRAQDIQRCRQLGVASYLLKPIKQSELVGAIIAAMSSSEAAQLWPAQRSGAQAGVAGGRADASTVVTPYPGELEKRRLNILLAEDNRVNQLLAAGVIENDGHRVVVANNGREALEKLARERFDLVLMDVQMPEMDGFEATAVIRSKEKESGGHLPIIALTAHAMKGDRERCLDAGMDAYVAKPIKARVLLETIRATCQSMCPVV